MTRSWIPHDYEGWPNGHPEFEMHPSIKNAAGAFDYVACSGEQAPTPFQYNQDGTLYTNEVFVIAETAFGSYNDDRLRVEVWEDDSDPCKATSGRAPKTSSNLVGPIVGLSVSGVSFTIAVIGGSPRSIVGSAASLAGTAINLIVAAQQDDFVGRADLIPEAGCWPESGPARFAVKDQNLSLTARVDLDFRTGEMREPICPLTASISGPGSIETGSGSPVPSPNYHANWSGGQGTGPTFEWRLNGTLKSTSQSWTMSPVTPGNHTVKLTVVHGLDTVVKTKPVTVSTGCTLGCGGGVEPPPPNKSKSGN